jgi:transposase
MVKTLFEKHEQRMNNFSALLLKPHFAMHKSSVQLRMLVHFTKSGNESFCFDCIVVRCFSLPCKEYAFLLPHFCQ